MLDVSVAKASVAVAVGVGELLFWESVCEAEFDEEDAADAGYELSVVR